MPIQGRYLFDEVSPSMDSHDFIDKYFMQSAAYFIDLLTGEATYDEEINMVPLVCKDNVTCINDVNVL